MREEGMLSNRSAGWAENPGRSMRVSTTTFFGFLVVGVLAGCASGEELGPFAHSTFGTAGIGGSSGPDAAGPGAGGLMGSGGIVPVGGAPPNGGAPSGGVMGTTGGSSPGGAPMGSGGASGGGAGASGAAGGGGSGCPDTDGDNATDCVEDADGDEWTDKAIFNGLHVSRGNQCSSVGDCRENDTFAEVQSCMQGNVDEEKDQYSGWDWQGNPPDDIQSSEYGFLPNWSGSDTTWSAEWEGCIHLTTAGPHCFQIEGGTSEGCAALYFNGNTDAADCQSGTGPKCFTVPAGNYPILFHYTMDNGSSSSMHVQYCDAGGAATCTPSAAIPAKLLRAACP